MFMKIGIGRVLLISCLFFFSFLSLFSLLYHGWVANYSRDLGWYMVVGAECQFS